ncbi:TIGR04211 family SH3 domain-containing protein [Pseudoalteromonas sp.]|uniref:TIGR04211 family SH3 domain-containing protein n=1 Tax=Pseudoalteromonas sp. TaxID=53249 RepID=UPI003568687F
MFKSIAGFLLFASLSTAIQAETTTENDTATEVIEVQTSESSVSSTAYITDNLFVYMHSGPGKNYRILGSVQAGTELQLLDENKESGYSQVKDSRGRTGWIDKRNISKRPGLAQQNAKLKSQLAELQAELNSAQRDMPLLRQSTNELELKNRELSAEIENLNSQIANSRNQKQQTSDKQQKQLLIYGGGIAFIGILMGIIITLVLSRRKRYDGWA